jgi:outer membrane receptor protein involved in Fe transport
MNSITVAGTTVTGVLSLFSAFSANAEPAVAPENASSSLQEIVVTASKRASTVQETPISISAVTGSELLARGVDSLATLAQGTPGVSLKSEGPSQTEIEMRGMTSSGGNSATIGFYLDDIPLAGPASAQNGHVVIDPDLYDLNRVEILRGPQGTLFGSGSMGGTVRLISNQPNVSQFQSTAQSVLSGIEGGGRASWVAGLYYSDFHSLWGFRGTTPNYSAYMDLGTLAPATTPNWFDADSPTTLKGLYERQVALHV